MLTKKQFDDIPEALKDHISMSAPNKPILIFEGETNFRLSESGDIIKALGSLQLIWQPTIQLLLICEYQPCHLANFFYLEADYLYLELNDGSSHQFYITKTFSDNHMIEAKGMKMPSIGNIELKVDEVMFGIPNLRDLRGSQTKEFVDDNWLFSRRRIVLTNDKFKIILEKRQQYRELCKSLKEEGGHLILYNGLLRKKRANQIMSYEEVSNQIACLNFFLSFINGRSVCAMFLDGELKKNEVWKDYSYLNTEIYRSSFSWVSLNTKAASLQLLWMNFCKIWNYREDKQFLTFAIKWYSEANMNEVSTDTRIIMAQTTLELIYNWWLIEKKGLIKGTDSNLGAENKIRLILSQVGISYEIPEELTSLIRLKNQKGKTITDGPNSIVTVRNSLVHANTNNMRKISNLTPDVRGDVVMLANYYIVISLLKILDYSDEFQKPFVHG